MAEVTVDRYTGSLPPRAACRNCAWAITPNIEQRLISHPWEAERRAALHARSTGHEVAVVREVHVVYSPRQPADGGGPS